jgi:hypothetical protein
MGRFLHTPGNGSRFLKITKPAGYENLFILPEGQKDAWTIQTKASKNEILVSVNTNSDIFDTCLIVAAIRGYSYYYRLIPNASQSTFKIQTTDFPAGIAVLTLLDRNAKPLAERLVFVNQDRYVHSEIKTNKAKNLPRDLVSIEIDLKNEELDFKRGQYSLSVYDASFGASRLIDNANIISSNYLSPEIRGKINKPNYYFQSDSRETLYHLDLLLMTQGWRKYSYLKNLAEVEAMKLPESQDLIKGKITRFKFGGEPYPTAAEVLIYFAGNSKTISTDEEGNFSFIPEYSLDHTSPLMLSARDMKGSEKVYLNLNNEVFRKMLEEGLAERNEGFTASAIAPLAVFEDLNRNLNLNRSNSIWIDEVAINRKFPDEYEDLEIGMIKNFSNTRSPTPELLLSSMDMNDILSNMGYNGVIEDDTFKFYYQGVFEPAIFIIDGIDRHLLYSEILIEYPPEVIENIYVTIGIEPFMVYGSRVVVYIETDIEKFRAKMYENKIQNSRIIPGLQIYKEFYSPKYETQEEKKNPKPDLRKTVYWNPDVKISKDGKALVSFYNSDRYGKINCVLEGMTDSGVPVYGETTYSVATYRE